MQTHSCGGNEYRGDSGPLHVTRYEARGQLDQAWLEAGQAPGRRVKELDNRGSNFYLALHWAQKLAERWVRCAERKCK